MYGFELQHNGKTISAIIGQKNISIFITKINNEIILNFSGSDFQKSQGITWYNSNVNSGDHIIIALKNIKKGSIPIETHKLFVKKSQTIAEKQSQLEHDFARFKQLKKILNDRKLI